MIALTATALFTPLERIEQPLLLVEDNTIVEVTSRAQREIPQNCRTTDFGDGILAPGFVDIHIHGGAGHDVMEAGAKRSKGHEQIQDLCTQPPQNCPDTQHDRTLAPKVG